MPWRKSTLAERTTIDCLDSSDQPFLTCTRYTPGGVRMVYRFFFLPLADMIRMHAQSPEDLQLRPWSHGAEKSNFCDSDAS